MKTLIVNDTEGNIIFTMQGTEIQDNYSCIVTDIEEGKEIVSVDVSTGQIITKEKDTRVSDIQEYLNNTDDSTISKVEDTILEIESNKIENGGM
ncbi:conserved hypothetical protein [Clostridium neonatale]|uniref:hypothetical protein n=1 Tax=Clostridium neonatale TaxID=137838 RepID=UPI00291BB6A4|nr:hypothetical protein [Clostridium neonatale]CAI3584445.1 conserved hypothetical protein [Clostridium neonatale]